MEVLADMARAHHKLLKLAPLLEAIRRMDAIAMRAMLREHFTAETPVEFGRATVAPLMREVGRLWSEGELSVAAEHMVSAEIRGLLSACLDTLPFDPKARILIVTTMAGEHHEIGALLTAIVARNAGLGALYLGPNLPVGDIVSAAQSCKATLVCLSSLVGKPRNVRAKLEHLRASLPPSIDIWTGGPGFAEAQTVPGLRFFGEIYEFERAAEALAETDKPSIAGPQRKG